jgi:MtN3 and saliva related transmembrane protein
MNEDTIGLLAAIITTSCWLPQIYKTYKTRDTTGISLISYSVLFVGIVLWLVYGIMIANIPTIVANIAALLCIGTMVLFKLRHG